MKRPSRGCHSVRRTSLRVLAFGVLSLALLTCTPPNFGPAGTGEPLTISPLQPRMVASTQLGFVAAGGNPPYTYSVSSGPGTIVAQTGLYTAPAQPAVADVKVTDSGGASVQTQVTITPKALSLSPEVASLAEGASVVLTGGGGTLPYTGSVNGGGTLTKTSDTTWRYDANNQNPVPWVVTVTDASIPVKTHYAYLTVTSPPAVLTISPKNITITQGDQFTFSAGGGTPSYTFDLQSGVGSITSDGLYTASQIGSAEVRVTDVAAATDVATVTVQAPPLQIIPTFVNVAFNSGFDFNASGGKAPYVFSILSGGSRGTIVADTGVFTALSEAGTVVIQLTDSLPSSPSEATVNVYPPLVIAPKPATVDAAATKTFTATGGVPGYTFTLVSGVGSIDAASGVYTAPASPGSAVVKVTDSIGNIDQTTITVVDPADWAPAITVDTTGGQYASLALTGSGAPYIAYQSGNTLKLAKWTGSAFAKETVDSSGDYPGKYVSLALDASGNPRISYYYSKTNHEGLGYAEWNGSWTVGKLPGTANDPIGQYTSLALDPTDSYHPRIAYYDARPGSLDLGYVSYNGTSWTLSAVDTASDVGTFASLRLKSGYAHIAYFDVTNGDLRYAYQDAGGWHYETVDTAGNVGQYASLALDSLGYPHMAYYDADGKNLMYAWKDAGGWHYDTVDTTGDVGQYASLALDSAGNPRIAYYDATNGDLKYAAWNGSVWVVAAIDTSGTVGPYASLQLDSSDRMRIAYYDASGKLKYIAQQ
jgi:hypothetical protein